MKIGFEVSHVLQSRDMGHPFLAAGEGREIRPQVSILVRLADLFRAGFRLPLKYASLGMTRCWCAPFYAPTGLRVPVVTLTPGLRHGATVRPLRGLGASFGMTRRGAARISNYRAAAVGIHNAEFSGPLVHDANGRGARGTVKPSFETDRESRDTADKAGHDS